MKVVALALTLLLALGESRLSSILRLYHFEFLFVFMLYQFTGLLPQMFIFCQWLDV